MVISSDAANWYTRFPMYSGVSRFRELFHRPCINNELIWRLEKLAQVTGGSRCLLFFRLVQYHTPSGGRNGSRPSCCLVLVSTGVGTALAWAFGVFGFTFVRHLKNLNKVSNIFMLYYIISLHFIIY